MKKIFLLIILFTFLDVNSQTFLLKGYVKDSINHFPIKDVNIYIKGSVHGTTSNDSGYFSIEIKNTDKLIFSHLNYFKKEIQIKYSSPKIFLLENKINFLNEISINAQSTISLSKNLLIYVNDYILLDEGKILILGYKQKSSHKIILYIIDNYGNVLYEKLVNNAKELFKDCFGEIYYITNKEAVRVKIINNSIVEENIFQKEEFERTYKLIEFKIGNNIFFSTFENQFFTKKCNYININDDYSVIHTIITVYDSSKIDMFENEYNFFYYAKKASNLGLSVTSVYKNLKKLRENQNLDWFDRNGRYSSIKSYFKSLNNNILVFNQTDTTIKTYNIEGKLINKYINNFLINPEFNGNILIDENKVYIIFNKNSITYIGEYNSETGNLGEKIVISDFPYIEKIKIFKNNLYFMYKKKIDEDYKQLYKMHI